MCSAHLIWHIPTNNFASLRTIAVVVKRCFKYHWDKAKVEMAAFASVVVLKSIRLLKSIRSQDEIVAVFVFGFLVVVFLFTHLVTNDTHRQTNINE